MGLVVVDVWKDEDAFVAKCRGLPVATQGDTEAEALENLKEALELYLEDPDVQRELLAKRTQMITVDVPIQLSQQVGQSGCIDEQTSPPIGQRAP